MAQSALIEELMEALDGKAIPDGGGGAVSLPTLTNPASASEVFAGEEYIDGDGMKKTGTFTLESELAEQDDLIAQLAAALERKAGPSGAKIETCTVNIVRESLGQIHVGATCIVDGEISYIADSVTATTYTVDNVVCGSFFVVSTQGEISTYGGGYIGTYRSSEVNGYHITANAGETVTIQTRVI